MKQPVIFVVNLESSADRREFIAEQLEKLGLKYEIFNAVDGRKLPQSEIDAAYDSKAAINFFHRELTRGEIGCSWSHLKIYEKMVSEKIPEALILEDDVILDQDFKEILSRKGTFPKDWELVFFSHNNAVCSVWDKLPVWNQYKLVKFVEHPNWTSGYLIRLSGAEKLLECGYPIRMPADWLTGNRMGIDIRIYGIKPVCIPQNKDFQETISGRFELNQENWLGKAGLRKGPVYAVIEFYRGLKRRSRVFKNFANGIKNSRRIRYFFRQFRRIK
ncbi:MAG: glycosyltransferase family 25 protein [Spirochaetia bacterium]|nr:glycosyltransferase family 25 protein [Spirochaetia bacterium]